MEYVISGGKNYELPQNILFLTLSFILWGHKKLFGGCHHALQFSTLYFVKSSNLGFGWADFLTYFESKLFFFTILSVTYSELIKKLKEEYYTYLFFSCHSHVYPVKVSWFQTVFLVYSMLQRNERKQFNLRYHSSKVEFLNSFILENWRYQKDIYKLTDL